MLTQITDLNIVVEDNSLIRGLPKNSRSKTFSTSHTGQTQDGQGNNHSSEQTGSGTTRKGVQSEQFR